MKEKPLTYEHGVKLAKEVIAFLEVPQNWLITAFQWVCFIQGELLWGALVVPSWRLKPLVKQARLRHRLQLVILLICCNTQLSSMQSTKVHGAAVGNWPAKQILQLNLPESRVSCSGFCQEVHVANLSLQSPPAKLASIPYKSTDNLVLIAIALQTAEKELPRLPC